MEESTQEDLNIVGREQQPHDHKNKKNCVINIFCDDKQHGWDHGNKDDGHCVINIFCNEKKSDDHCDYDDKKYDDKKYDKKW